MRVICAGFLVTLALSFAGFAIADEQSRTAAVVDTAGQSTEVTHVSVSGVEVSNFSLGLTDCDLLAVYTETFQIAIPVCNVVSVSRADENSTVKYVFRDQEFTATGELGTGYLEGKSDFGGFKISTAKIRRVDFKSPPIPLKLPFAERPSNPATLSLADGSTVRVTRLERFTRWLDTYGYIIGGEWRPYADQAIVFLRGESKSTVTMQDIAKVDFGADDAVSVTLRNGNSATGKLGSGKDGIEGFCGTFEKGYFFIDKKHIKSIQFVSESK